ncbi:acyltransferase family protein [Mycobacterium conspicuum]|uniref:Acyltransferase n=1 Tax=Mycobacterium conspicuum TaxID=44010 RepID=A0A7I7YDZ3_9MYCO|nr:acyltransferase [Mycobacterium conspicuum]
MRQADSISTTEGVAGRSSAKSGFRPDIEGLRAVAVLAVVLFHAGVPGVGGGFIGVDVFFVISGFLITGLLWRETSTTGTVRLRSFYGARARRLLPASAAVGVVTLVASTALLSPLQLRDVIYDGIACALYVGNMWFVLQNADYFNQGATPSPFQHYWSLGVEEQFYFVWPAMIIATAWVVRQVRRRRGAQAPASVRPYVVILVLVAALSFAASLALTQMWPPIAFFMMPTRAWQLAVGGLVALTASQWRRLPTPLAAIAGWAGLGVILLACAWLGPSTPYPGTAALWPVLGAALVLGAGCAIPAQGCGHILGLPPMRAIGRVSYSWYLWHWPLLVLAAPLFGHPLGLPARLATAAISGALAVLTLRFVENPLRFRPALRRSPARSLALGGVATAVAVCVGVALLVSMPPPVGRGSPAPTPAVTWGTPLADNNIDAYDAAVQGAFAQVQTAVAGSAELKAVPSNLTPALSDVAAETKAMGREICASNGFQLFAAAPPPCATGDVASPTTVAVVGDSHAVMFSPAFKQIAERRHWRLEMLSMGLCPLLDVPIIHPILHREYTECAQWRTQSIARLQANHPRLIVLSIARTYDAGTGVVSYGPAWIDGLTRLVRQLRNTGAQVLVLGPTPNLVTSVPICLSGHLDDATACSPRRSVAVNQPGVTAEAAATKAGGGHYSDLTDLFCATTRCPVVVGNLLVYLDSNHLTLEYSRLLAPAIGALADRALASG